MLRVNTTDLVLPVTLRTSAIGDWCERLNNQRPNTWCYLGVIITGTFLPIPV